MLTLVAKWDLEQDPTMDVPTHVYWEDGRPATLLDYHEYRLDTHEITVTDDSFVMRMYPELVGDVRYDSYARMWFVLVPGKESMSLDLSNIATTDEEIIAALYQLPVVYRCIIHR